MVVMFCNPNLKMDVCILTSYVYIRLLEISVRLTVCGIGRARDTISPTTKALPTKSRREGKNVGDPPARPAARTKPSTP
jgi:hypothetical protein